MSNPDILNTLKKEKGFLNKEFGVEEIGIFGFCAHGEETPKSDLDVIVKMKTVDYSLFAGLYLYLEKKLNRKIDLIRKGNHLPAKFLGMIRNDVVYA